MADYKKGQSWGRQNIEDALWYAQTENDKTAIKNNERLAFGDKVYVIATKKVYIIGSDGNWNEM